MTQPLSDRELRELENLGPWMARIERASKIRSFDDAYIDGLWSQPIWIGSHEGAIKSARLIAAAPALAEEVLRRRYQEGEVRSWITAYVTGGCGEQELLEGIEEAMNER